MGYKAVIFDMDGTILDTLEDLKNSTNYALRENSYPERTTDEIRQFVGNGIRNLITRALPENTSNSEFERTFSTFAAYYELHCADETKPYEGILDLLTKLRQHGFKTAVVSNKADFAVEKLCRQYFDGLFDASMGEKESQGIRKKPAADMVNIIVEELGLAKSEVVYVGDSDVDLVTARNSDVDCIAVTWGFRSEKFLIEHGAKVLAHSPDDILKIVKN